MADAADARERLKQERSDLQSINPKKTVPFGFFARPKRRRDGSTDLLEWTIGIVPKAKSAYCLPNNSCCYEAKLIFSADFPIDPPHVIFTPPIYHTNVFDTGSVCLSILLPAGHHKGTVASHWSPTMSIKDILIGLQNFLDEPNPYSTANKEACAYLQKEGRAAYDAKIKKEALKYEEKLEAYKKSQK